MAIEILMLKEWIFGFWFVYHLNLFQRFLVVLLSCMFCGLKFIFASNVILHLGLSVAEVFLVNPFRFVDFLGEL